MQKLDILLECSKRWVCKMGNKPPQGVNMRLILRYISGACLKLVFVTVRNSVMNVETKIRITVVTTAGSKFEKEAKMNNPLSKSIPLIM